MVTVVVRWRINSVFLFDAFDMHAYEFSYFVSKSAGEQSKPNFNITFHSVGHGLGMVLTMTERCVVRRGHLVLFLSCPHRFSTRQDIFFETCEHGRMWVCV